MERGGDISVQAEGFVVIHQNLPGLWVREHKHPHHELFIPLSGAISVRVGESSWVVEPGKMLWLEGNALHSFESSQDDDGERLIVMIEPSSWLANKGVSRESCVLPAHQLLKEIAFYMLSHPKSEANRSLANAVVTSLSEMLAAKGKSADDIQLKETMDKRTKAALDFMKREFVQEISVETIALHAQVTTRTLLRLFSEDLGLSPKQVLTKYRVQEACRLLRETHLSVTNVAFESGFGSLSSFVESFRNQVGVLPSDYKAFHVRKSEKE